MTQNSKNSGNCTEQINKIFLKFSTFYGHIWRSQFKNEYYTEFARNEWARALKEFDEKLIEQAVNECLKNRVMPPALAQFIECCKQLLAKEQPYFQREIYKPCNPVVAQSHLKKIKTMLNIK
ncbi:MAG: Vir protein [Legionella sp.]|nr:Vir protein [Legionella sp.]